MENNEDLLELSARLSAQRFLLEQLYANAFTGNADGFAAFMGSALEMTRLNSTRAGPMSEESALELQARTAVHLQRFQESVETRLRQG